MRIDSSSSASVSPFTIEEVKEATKCSNFNKGLGPDCFDGNVLKITNSWRAKFWRKSPMLSTMHPYQNT